MLHVASSLVQAYSWLAAWYVMFTFDACWAKMLCDQIPMTNWARVYYSNGMAAAMLALVLPWRHGEHAIVRAAEWGLGLSGTFLLSCVVGLGMSHATYLLRSSTSATTAAVVGVVCKLLTVALSLLLWKAASPAGLACLLCSIGCGSLYQQAPFINEAAEQGKVDSSVDLQVGVVLQALDDGKAASGGQHAASQVDVQAQSSLPEKQLQQRHLNTPAHTHITVISVNEQQQAFYSSVQTQHAISFQQGYARADQKASKTL